MYYQCNEIIKGTWISCILVDNSNPEKWIVEYNVDGNFKQKEVHPENIKHLDYNPSELSQ
jgi:hypothetical protein